MKQKEKIEFTLGEVVTLIIVIILFLAGILTVWGPEIPDWIKGANNYLDSIPGYWRYLTTVLWCIDRILCIIVTTGIATFVIYTITWITRVFMISLYNLLSRIVTRLQYKDEIPRFDDLIDKKPYIWVAIFIVMFIITATLEIIFQPHIAIYVVITVLIVGILMIVFQDTW